MCRVKGELWDLCNPPKPFSCSLLADPVTSQNFLVVPRLAASFRGPHAQCVAGTRRKQPCTRCEQDNDLYTNQSPNPNMFQVLGAEWIYLSRVTSHISIPSPNNTMFPPVGSSPADGHLPSDAHFILGHSSIVDFGSVLEEGLDLGSVKEEILDLGSVLEEFLELE